MPHLYIHNLHKVIVIWKHFLCFSCGVWCCLTHRANLELAKSLFLDQLSATLYVVYPFFMERKPFVLLYFLSIVDNNVEISKHQKEKKDFSRFNRILMYSILALAVV